MRYIVMYLFLIFFNNDTIYKDNFVKGNWCANTDVNNFTLIITDKYCFYGLNNNKRIKTKLHKNEKGYWFELKESKEKFLLVCDNKGLLHVSYLFKKKRIMVNTITTIDFNKCEVIK